MIALLLGLVAAAGNAVASVLQGRAARTAPDSDAFRLRLVWDLLRRPIWLGGIGALVVAFVAQAAALSMGSLALVQPVLSTELPFTMVLLGLLSARGLRVVPWGSVALLTAGLAAFLIAAAPEEGQRTPHTAEWIIAVVVGAAAVALLIMGALVVSGSPRAVLMGIAASLGFAFTAAFMKTAADVADNGFGGLLTAWSLYAMVLCGLGSLFLLQNALQAGSLVAAQPALTVTDPVVSICLGVALFDDQIRSGPWMIAEAVGIGLILLGSIGLARSPIFQSNVKNASSREGQEVSVSFGDRREPDESG